MEYQEAIQYIHQTPKFSRELGNRLLQKLLMHCGNPERQLRFIHIAGTNGKGSAAVMLAEILQSAGYRTGLFTSPYLERFNERIQINREPIPDESLAELVTVLKDRIERYDAPVSEFALDTALAFCWFAQQNADVVVLETGLGGRLDATNVIPRNLAAVIMAIGLDHTQYLGNTIAEITAEKCGIIKENCPVICYPTQEEEVMSVITAFCRKKEAPLFLAELPQEEEGGFRLQGIYYSLGLKGNFQMLNAATVLKTVEVLRQQGLKISDTAVSRGLLQANHPGRYERFGKRIILDGAHNPQAIRTLCETLTTENRPIIFCTAMMEDKDYMTCAKILGAYADGIVATELNMPRCCSAQHLAEELRKYSTRPIEWEKEPERALEKALSMCQEEGILCICGSLYLAGAIRPYLRKRFSDETQ